MLKYLLLLFVFYHTKSIAQLSFPDFHDNNDSINIVLAKEYFSEQKYKEVISTCNNIKESREVLNLIAEAYSELGDYNKSIHYYERLIHHNVNKKDRLYLFKNYVDIAKVYKKLNTNKNYRRSISYVKQAIQLSSKVNISDLELHSAYNNLGNYYIKLKNKDNALLYHLKAYEIAKKINNNRKIELSLCNIGGIYLDGIDTNQKKLVIASNYFKKSLQYGKDFSFYNYLNLGIISYLKDLPLESINYYNQALQAIKSSDFILHNNFPSTKSIKISPNKDKIIRILYEKYYAWIKLYYQEKKQVYLIEALKTIELADNTLDALLNELENEESQLLWQKKASSFYILGVNVSHLLEHSEKAFYFTEKNKALLLLNSVIQSESKLKLPKNILKREITLKKEIYHLNFLVHKAKNDSLNNLLFDKQRAFDLFQDSLKTSYPKYSMDRINAPLYDLKKVQENITNTSTIYVSYIWDKTENQYDALFGVAITKDTSVVFKIKGLEAFDKSVTRFRALVSKPFKVNEDIKQFQKASFDLYNRVFPSEAIKALIREHDKLILLPDSDLQHIPFEALITDKNSNNYLIYNNEVTYAYSYSFLKKNQDLVRKPNNKFLGFAPGTFGYDGLPSLPRSQSEIKNIKNLISGVSYLDNEATKENFFSKISNYNIIHLSTHANANDSIAPWIAFKEKKLYLNELYTTKNQADLVFLSACNSSLGETNAGEGVFSLARGFFYSGANSVISSLWNVNDKSNAEITTSFYHYLKQGKTKSASIRQAKLDYLNTHTLSEASPYYWSSLILIGDDSSINLYNNSLYFIALAILFIIIIFFFLKKLKSVGNNS